MEFQAVFILGNPDDSMILFRVDGISYNHCLEV